MNDFEKKKAHADALRHQCGPELLRLRLRDFFRSLRDRHFHRHRHLAVQPNVDGVLADILDRVADFDLTAIHVESTVFQFMRDIRRRDRPEQLIVLAGTPREVQGQPVELLCDFDYEAFMALVKKARRKQIAVAG